MSVASDRAACHKSALQQYGAVLRPAIRSLTAGLRRGGLFLLAAVLGPATVSNATYYHHDHHRSDEVKIGVKGEIRARCTVAGLVKEIDLGVLKTLDQRQSRDFPFNLSCNAPFGFQLSSENGAMRHETVSGNPKGFLSRFPYEVSLAIPTDGGAVIRKTCESDELMAGEDCGEADSGEDVAIDKTANLKLSWGPIGKPLIAGKYSDVIKLQLSMKN